MEESVKVDDFKGYAARSRICGHHSCKINKAIDVVVYPATCEVMFEVFLNKNMIFRGPNLDGALDWYNEHPH